MWMLDVGDLPPKCCPHVESLKPSPSFRARQTVFFLSTFLDALFRSKIRISHHGDDHSGHRGNSPCWPGWTARFDMDDQAPVGLAIQQLWKLKVAKGRLIVDVCVPADQRSVFAERTAVT